MDFNLIGEALFIERDESFPIDPMLREGRAGLIRESNLAQKKLEGIFWKSIDFHLVDLFQL